MTIRILLLEDSNTDAQLVEVELRGAGLDFIVRRAVIRRDFERALREFHPDIIIADHRLPLAASTSCWPMWCYLGPAAARSPMNYWSSART